MKFQRILFFIMSFILVSMIAFMLMLAVTEMPLYGNPSNPPFNLVWERYVYRGVEESGGTNLVSNVLLDYRGYDTLMESTVLFATVVSIMLIWGTTTTSQKEIERQEKELKKLKKQKKKEKKQQESDFEINE
ncbi:MAG: hydrogen gas-evolving membrane-bound hydrogenase subunit E [Bacillota bacterium]